MHEEMGYPPCKTNAPITHRVKIDDHRRLVRTSWSQVIRDSKSKVNVKSSHLEIKSIGEGVKPLAVSIN